MSWIVIAAAIAIALAAYVLLSEWLVRRQRHHGRDDLGPDDFGHDDFSPFL